MTSASPRRARRRPADEAAQRVEAAAERLGIDRAGHDSIVPCRRWRDVRHPALRLRGVAVARLHPATRAWTEILRGLDWEVAPGERWVLLGPNGAGKSTLLTLVAGRRLPDQGHRGGARRGLGRTHMPTLRERIGVVGTRIAEEVAFWPALDVLDVILSGATGTIVLLQSRIGDAQRERAGLLAGRLGIERLLDRPFNGCSDGERQRVLLARALMPARRCWCWTSRRPVSTCPAVRSSSTRSTAWPGTSRRSPR